MLNLDKLNSIDINNIDLNKIPELVLQYRKIVMLVFLGLTVLMVGKMFSDYRGKEKAVRLQMSQAQAKISLISQRNAAIQNYNNFQAAMPKEMSAIDLITKISQYASHYNIAIASLNPSGSKEVGLYTEIDMNFTAEADDFKSLMLFLRSIERSDPPLRIGTWSGSEDDDGRISCDISLSAVHIHP